jgi:hypothetical protein
MVLINPTEKSEEVRLLIAKTVLLVVRKSPI